eukprot:10276299-Heterocapsa_arctica.AAC.1
MDEPVLSGDAGVDDPAARGDALPELSEEERAGCVARWRLVVLGWNRPSSCVRCGRCGRGLRCCGCAGLP